MFSVTHPRFGARFEQVEETAVLQQELLGAERKRSLAGRRVRCRFDRGDNGNFVGKSGSRRVETGPSRCAVEQAADRPPVADQSGGRAKRAAPALRRRQDLQGIALGVHGCFRFGGARRARHGTDGGRETDEESALAFESFGGAGKPVSRRASLGVAVRKIDEARRTSVQPAEQVHAIGKVARRIQSGSFQKGSQVAMT